MTREELLSLPPTVDVTTAAAVLGIRRTCAYELIRTGEWPSPILHLGRAVRVPTAPLLELVGIREYSMALRASA